MTTQNSQPGIDEARSIIRIRSLTATHNPQLAGFEAWLNPTAYFNFPQDTSLRNHFKFQPQLMMRVRALTAVHHPN